MHTHTREFQQKLTPQKAYEILLNGNKRFINNLKINRNLLQQLNDTANAQFPFAVVLSCMDSRTSVELIFDQGLGEIFSIRIAGNIVNEDVLGSMEYACEVAGSKLIVVLGHTRCGAIKGACEGIEMGHLTSLLEKIKPSVMELHPMDCSNVEFAEKVAHLNVIRGMDDILERSKIIHKLYNAGKIGIVGGVYSVENGTVDFTKEMFNDEQVPVHQNSKQLA